MPDNTTHASVPSQPPTMIHSGKGVSPKFFFLSLAVLVFLITQVTALLTLSFRLLDRVYPDILSDPYGYAYGYASYADNLIQSTLAIIIIVTPIFLVLSYFWRKATVRQALNHADNTIKRWMLYFIIFLSGIISAIDLITLVRYFLQGEITTRFLLKVFIVLVVALIIGSYYLLELRGQITKMRGRLFAIISIALVLGAVTSSFLVTGSPQTQRALRLDERRIQDLQNIQSQVITHWQTHKKLPDSLDMLASSSLGFFVPSDPEQEKGKLYEYAIIDEAKNTFELCASFTKASPDRPGGIGVQMRTESPLVKSGYPGYGGTDFSHAEGRACFPLSIDPLQFPPFDQAPVFPVR